MWYQRLKKSLLKNGALNKKVYKKEKKDVYEKKKGCIYFVNL